jgi:hypothetical protein
MKQEVCYLMNNSCHYCGNLSFGQYHVECYRLFTYLSVNGLSKKEITEIINQKWEQSIQYLYKELKPESISPDVDETKDKLIELEEIE